MKLTAEIARKLLFYDENSGRLYWRCREKKWFKKHRDCKGWNKKYANKEALTTGKKGGYRFGDILGNRVLSHRVVWLIKTGEWPDQIDHINGDPSDNRWSNLRNVTHSGNLRNCKRRKDNTSGFVGVDYVKKDSKWRAKICGKSIGYFSSIDEAVQARKSAEKEYGFHPNHGKSR